VSSSVVWFELPAADTERARDFYGRLLGWTFEPFGKDDYHMASAAGGAIYAAAGENGLLAYFGVDDVDGAVARVRELGGEAGPTEELPGIGRYARCTDSEGNRFALYQQDGAG
jgi:uncharacterized protein